MNRDPNPNPNPDPYYSRGSDPVNMNQRLAIHIYSPCERSVHITQEFYRILTDKPIRRLVS